MKYKDFLKRHWEIIAEFERKVAEAQQQKQRSLDHLFAEMDKAAEEMIAAHKNGTHDKLVSDWTVLRIDVDLIIQRGEEYGIDVDDFVAFKDKHVWDWRD